MGFQRSSLKKALQISGSTRALRSVTDWSVLRRLARLGRLKNHCGGRSGRSAVGDHGKKRGKSGGGGQDGQDRIWELIDTLRSSPQHGTSTKAGGVSFFDPHFSHLL